jgi:hypothetical protein
MWTVDSGTGDMTLGKDACFAGMRFGMAITPQVDGTNIYSLVARKNGARIYQIDYDEEEPCEKMIDAHKFLQESHREGSPEQYAGLLRVSLSPAKKIRFFDPKTGAEDWGVRFKRS